MSSSNWRSFRRQGEAIQYLAEDLSKEMLWGISSIQQSKGA